MQALRMSNAAKIRLCSVELLLLHPAALHPNKKSIG
jgi:hypothetical protein